MTTTADIVAQVPKRTQPIIVIMIVLSCLGGLMAFTVPVGMIMWLNDQYKLVSQTDQELMTKAKAVMLLPKLPAGFRYMAPTFTLSKKNLGQAFFQDDDGTSFYFEKKEAGKMPAVRRRMADDQGLGDHFTVKEKGELPVAGSKLEYVRGISQRDAGVMFNEIHGFIPVNDKTIVEVMTGTPDGHKLDMGRVKTLLGSIQSFTP